MEGFARLLLGTAEVVQTCKLSQNWALVRKK
jgi:hypothetical protein